MKKSFLLFFIVLISHFAHAQDFITRWDLSYAGSNTNSITFGVGTTGVVNYTWENEIDVRNISKGVYYLKVGNVSKKVIVE